MCIDDVQTYIRWINDESLGSGLGNFAVNMTEEKEKEWINTTNRADHQNFALIRKEDDLLLGNYGLELKDDAARRYHVGGFIGEKENRGKGYGTEALTLITKYGFEILNAQTIYSTIFSFNAASVKSALKAGYKEVGRYRSAYYYNGKFHDAICVDITREDYYNNKK